VTARDVHLAKFENAGVGAENCRYRPGGSSGIGNDNSNSGDQVSRHVFKPGVETSPDHLLSGRPGSNRKPDDARPCYEFQRDARNFHPLTMHEDPFQVLMQYPSLPLRLRRELTDSALPHFKHYLPAVLSNSHQVCWSTEERGKGQNIVGEM
jgi:hypothetical protein